MLIKIKIINFKRFFYVNLIRLIKKLYKQKIWGLKMKKKLCIYIITFTVFLSCVLCGCMTSSETDNLEFSPWKVISNNGVSGFSNGLSISFYQGDFTLKTTSSSIDGSGTYILDTDKKLIVMEVDWVKGVLDNMDGKIYSFSYKFQNGNLVLTDTMGSGTITLKQS